MFSIVSAMSLNRVIWKDNSLPWNIPSDLKNFKELTSWKTILMWYNTYLSIWKALSNRKNIVLTTKNINIDWCSVFSSIENFLENIDETEEVMIIWWSNIYQQFLDKWLVDRLYISVIPEVYEWDAYFPFFEDKFKLSNEDDRWDYIFREYILK